MSRDIQREYGFSLKKNKQKKNQNNQTKMETIPQ